MSLLSLCEEVRDTGDGRDRGEGGHVEPVGRVELAVVGHALARPTDLPFTDHLLDDDGLVDEAKVHAAVDELVKRKPHLAARRPTGNVGQGARPEVPEIGLAAMLRRGA